MERPSPANRITRRSFTGLRSSSGINRDIGLSRRASLMHEPEVIARGAPRDLAVKQPSRNPAPLLPHPEGYFGLSGARRNSKAPAATHINRSLITSECAPAGQDWHLPAPVGRANFAECK